MMFGSSNIKPAHPFYPPSLQIPTYVPPTYSSLELFGGFGAVCFGILFFTFAFTSHLNLGKRLAVCWCVLSGLIHAILEGYFVVFVSIIPGDDNVLGQAWKEYGKGDSRYMWGEKTVWIIEAITSFFWGPLLLYVAYKIVRIPNEPNKYHPLLLIISMGQLYGTIVYFYTSLELKPATKSVDTLTPLGRAQDLIGRLYSKDTVPEPYYFWVYLIFLNSIWLVVPFTCIVWGLKTLMCDEENGTIEKKKKL
ncbi:Emopamil binding protein-domain-containing protein [Paraphysoderma sedebokerense]|nr:Emopamil binding protein-domain-containing protein [Paraphysoderma sedebokerense]